MIDFVVSYNIMVDVELIFVSYINEVMECFVKGDVKYCFVIDIGRILFL